MRIDFDFGDLETFLAVKETGSFHLAGQRLNLSQSAVTRRIQKLEQALGSVLFERSTRRVKPTLAAKRLQARAEAILEDAQETARAMRDESLAYDHQRGAVVTVACLPTIVARHLSPALEVFHAAHPRARIRLIDGAVNEVAEAVASGEADFGLCSIPMLEPTTTFEPLFDERIVFAMAKDHPLASSERVSWANLEQIPLILPARGTGNRLLIDEAMARADVPLHWSYEVSRSTTALDLVEGGRGVALVPDSAINLDRVARSLLSSQDIVRPIGMLSRMGQRDSATVDALKQAIRSIALIQPTE